MATYRSDQCLSCLGAVWPGVKCCHPCRRRLTVDQKIQLGIMRRPACELCGNWCPRGRNRYCSKACHVASAKTSKKCAECDVLFVVTRHRKQFCSRSCSYTCKSRIAAQRAISNPKPKMCRVWFPSCLECGQVFCARAAVAKRCSYRCRLANESRRITDLYAASCEVGADGAKWRALLVGYLRERDGDKCQCGCRRTIKFDLPSGPRGHPSGMGASVDHIMPRSLGGGNEMANLRLLTWKCNNRRGNRGGNEQLALIG